MILRAPSRSRWLPAVVVAALLLTTAPLATGGTVPPGPYFEPISLQRITLGQGVTEASQPVFTVDGHHLLFFAGGELWLVGTDGRGQHCLSCGVSGDVPITVLNEQEGIAQEFPDGKRVFFGPPSSRSVLTCAPSVLACATARIVPVDFTGPGVVPGLVLPGAAQTTPAYDAGGNQVAKLAPDGIHIGFSDHTSDSIEEMIVARLVPGPAKYTITDLHVINPQPATSILDRDPAHWSQGAALYEFKTFTRGGAAATFASVGAPVKGNPDVLEVDLATGKTLRLTSNPDWDEDDAISPDGRSLVLESDRGMHRADVLGLLPVAGFADAPEIAAAASYYVASGLRRQCDLQPWLLPATGDDGARLMGQPLDPYAGGDVHAANNVSGAPQWSPDGTAIALDTESYRTSRSAPYLLVAHLASRHPARPLPVVSSEPGTWAPAPADFHGNLQANQPVVLRGKASGTVTLLYTGLGIAAGAETVLYDRYSDDGRSFTTGRNVVTVTDIFTGPIRVDTDLTMTGQYRGSEHVHVTYSNLQSADGASASGHEVTTLDGTTVTGPPPEPKACPQALPHPQTLAVTTHRAGRTLRVHVQSTIRGAGLDERGSDTRPVYAAVVVLGRARVRTDQRGNATLRLPAGRGPWRVGVTAGDTIRPAVITVT